VIDRSGARDNPLMAMAVSGRIRVAETILASVHMSAPTNAAHLHTNDAFGISAYRPCKRELSKYVTSEPAATIHG
jgi:hypothetical protein